MSYFPHCIFCFVKAILRSLLMALEAETLDLLNFDNLAFYVSLAFTTVRVHVIYKKKDMKG